MAVVHQTKVRVAAILLLTCLLLYILRSHPKFTHGKQFDLLEVSFRANQSVATTYCPLAESDLLDSEQQGTHVQILASKLKRYARLTAAVEVCPNQTYTNNSDLYSKHSNLELNLFPFLKQPALRLRDSFVGRGIVVSMASKFMRFAVLLIKNLRILGSKLPIELMYKGDAELKADEREQLVQLGAKPIDLLSLMDDKDAQLDGFSTKAFALLFCSFREVILIDADVMFMHAPELLFDDEDYKKTGTLFFLDRYWHYESHSVGPQWFVNNMPQPISERLKQSQIYKGMTNNLIEAGVVVVDKFRNFHGVLTACRLLMKEERDGWFYKAFWGDKEAFWLAFELLAQDYAIHPLRPGIIGEIRGGPQTKQLVCGNVVHPGRDGRPFWWNGGVIAKYGSGQVLDFVAFVIEGDTDTSKPFENCFEKLEPVSLNAGELNVTQVLRHLWLNP